MLQWSYSDHNMAVAFLREMLEVVSLKGFENRKVTSLSGGQQQRVAIARALVNRPKVLLLDEPLGALDLRLRKDMQNELKRIQQAMGITFVYVTHDQEEALSMSDTVIVMDKGRIIMDGTPKEVFSQPERLWEVNLDVPQTTELLYRMKQSGLDVRLDIFDPEECADEIAAAIASR